MARRAIGVGCRPEYHGEMAESDNGQKPPAPGGWQSNAWAWPVGLMLGLVIGLAALDGAAGVGVGIAMGLPSPSPWEPAAPGTTDGEDDDSEGADGEDAHSEDDTRRTTTGRTPTSRTPSGRGRPTAPGPRVPTGGRRQVAYRQAVVTSDEPEAAQVVTPGRRIPGSTGRAAWRRRWPYRSGCGPWLDLVGPGPAAARDGGRPGRRVRRER